MKAVSTYIRDLLDAIEGDERFLMTLGAGLVNTWLCVEKYITSDNYVTITLGTVAVFISASSYTASVRLKQDAAVAMNRDTNAS